MLITDERTLKFIEILKSLGKIRFEKEFCEEIGMQFPNLAKIKNSESKNQSHHFTAEQLRKVGEIFGADMNYIYGFTDVPFRKNKVTLKVTLDKKA